MRRSQGGGKKLRGGPRGTSVEQGRQEKKEREKGKQGEKAMPTVWEKAIEETEASKGTGTGVRKKNVSLTKARQELNHPHHGPKPPKKPRRTKDNLRTGLRAWEEPGERVNPSKRKR